MKPSWYLHRLRCMSVGELGWRARNKVLEAMWRRRAGPEWPVPASRGGQGFRRVPWADLAVDPAASADLMAEAEAVLTEPWPIFDARCDLTRPDPDWHLDPRTGRAAPAEPYCFDIKYRDPARVPNVKHVWEVSRLHHVTLLAAAYFLSGDDRFAARAVDHLTSWWRKNPPLKGINWVSGIELGLRLICMVWARRLLDKMPGVERIFEENPVFRQQLHAHQSWIATFYSRFSSANNHVIAEMAGLLSAALAFPVFPESEYWAGLAASVLDREAGLQTFADGMNRELASDYQVFVMELLLIAGAEADLAGRALPDPYWRTLCRMADALAALVDAGGRTARQGDSDSGRALLLDAPGDVPGDVAPHAPVATVLNVCQEVFGAAPWWPARKPGGVTACLLTALTHPRRAALVDRPVTRPNIFPDAGITILRDHVPGPDEIWCRIDHGPHGFLATSAHAHADALSIEVREGGQEILIDPGTYCYHDEPAWRDYFRSTVAHNTLEVGGRDQAVAAGPFMWLTRPSAGLTAASGLGLGNIASAEAWHDGYASLAECPIHHRRLTLDRTGRSLTIVDWLTASAAVEVRLAYHFHPAIEVTLNKSRVEMSWGPPDSRRCAIMTLPETLTWRVHGGDLDPILGWYSPSFGQRLPAIGVVGSGQVTPDLMLRTQIAFLGSLAREIRALGDMAARGVMA